MLLLDGLRWRKGERVAPLSLCSSRFLCGVFVSAVGASVFLRIRFTSERRSGHTPANQQGARLNPLNKHPLTGQDRRITGIMRVLAHIRSECMQVSAFVPACASACVPLLSVSVSVLCARLPSMQGGIGGLMWGRQTVKRC